MAETNVRTSGGLGLPTILFLIFMVLKLCGVIDWSWWWVTAPLWIGCSIWFVFLIIVFIIQLAMKRKYWW